MNLTAALPLTAACVSFVFTIMVLDQFLRRRKTYQIVWTIGLFFFSLAAFAQYLGASHGWLDNPNYYRLWYLGGAIATSSFLGMGTVFLMFEKRVASFMLAGLVMAFIGAAVLVLTARLDLGGLPAHATEEVKGTGFPTYVRIITPFFNIFGAGFLAFGALQSAWTFWRKRIKPYRVVSNLFIAAGAFAASGAGLITRTQLLNGSDAFSFCTLLGVTLIFIGFLISIEVFEEFRIPFTNVILKQRKHPALLQVQAVALSQSSPEAVSVK